MYIETAKHDFLNVLQGLMETKCASRAAYKRVSYSVDEGSDYFCFKFGKASNSPVIHIFRNDTINFEIGNFVYSTTMGKIACIKTIDNGSSPKMTLKVEFTDGSFIRIDF